MRTITTAVAAAALCAGGWSASAQSPAAAAAAPEPLSGTMETTATVIGQTLHVVVGRSLFVNTERRLRRVYVSNPEVLDSFTSSPHQIVVTAKAPGVSSLVLWDETGQSKSYLVSSDVDVADLRHALTDAFPSENIRVEGRGDQVALAGTVSSAATGDAAVKMAGLFSKDVADSLTIVPPHKAQVRLKVRVVEIDRSRASQLGFNFFGAGVNGFSTTTGQFGAVTAASSSTTVSGSGSSTTSSGAAVSSLLEVSSLLSMFYYNKSLGLGAALQALVDKQIVQILAEPNITAVSGEKASFLAGGSFPYPLIEPGIGGANTITVVFRDYGVKVDFTPTVLPDGTIDLKVAPEVSALDYTNEVRHRRLYAARHLHPPGGYARGTAQRAEFRHLRVARQPDPRPDGEDSGYRRYPDPGQAFSVEEHQPLGQRAGRDRDADHRRSADRQCAGDAAEDGDPLHQRSEIR